VCVAEHLSADGQDHRPMAGQDGLEGILGRLIPPVHESPEQLAISQADGAAGAEEPTEVPPKVPHRCAGHVLPSAREPTLLILPISHGRSSQYAFFSPVAGRARP
jgi:hypothetical protein